jgi:putative lipoprotein
VVVTPGRRRLRRVTAALTPIALVLAAATARAEDDDPWLGRDKALHFSACAVLSAGGYGAAALATDDVRVRAGAGIGVGLAAGAAKEIWDLTGRGDPSARDLAWDVAGTATGVAVAALVDWALGKLSSGRAAHAP